MNMEEVKYWQMTDGNSIPRLGYGCFNCFGPEMVSAIRWAVKYGYRYIDSASCYQNEAEVGQAIAASDIPRQELFLLSKLWLTDYENVEAALLKTLKDLGTDYLDAYLLHWPGTDESRRLKAYEKLLCLQQKGVLKSIGVSNFLSGQLDKIQAEFGKYPVINQFECHPSYPQKELAEYCRQKGIQVIGYRPLNRGAYLTNPMLCQIAERYGKTLSQVILRWHVEKQQIPIPKSARQERIRENSEIFDFSLTAEEKEQISCLEGGSRAGNNPLTFVG